MLSGGLIQIMEGRCPSRTIRTEGFKSCRRRGGRPKAAGHLSVDLRRTGLQVI
jgi:hypothetical protein